MKNLLFGGAKFNSVVGDVGLLVLRVFAGLSLSLAHGMAKLPPSPQFVAGVTNLGFPSWAAYLSGFAEGICGLLLTAGFMTRPAALIIVINMSVAAFLQHANDPYQIKELALLFLSVAILFVCAGGGRFAVDRLIRK
jgi:putative oxidoreductase